MTFTGPAVRPQSSGAMREITYLLHNEGCFVVPGGRVARFRLLPPQMIILRNRHEKDLESGGGA